MENTNSDRKLVANRENAKKSTGPRTAAGKATARANSTTHGFFSRYPVVVLPPFLESLADYISLREDLRADLNPVGPLEEATVEQIANGVWKTRRLARYDTARITATARAAANLQMKPHADNRLIFPSASGKSECMSATSDLFQELTNLADHFSAGGGRMEDETEFLAFVWARNLSSGDNEEGRKSEDWIAVARDYVTSLNEIDREDLEAAFRQEMSNALNSVLAERAQKVVLESAVERSLIPDEVELEKVMRYENHLFRHIARNLAMLLDLQAARRERKGGVGL